MDKESIEVMPYIPTIDDANYNHLKLEVGYRVQGVWNTSTYHSKGTVIEVDESAWLTIQWDDRPEPSDWWLLMDVQPLDNYINYVREDYYRNSI